MTDIIWLNFQKSMVAIDRKTCWFSGFLTIFSFCLVLNCWYLHHLTPTSFMIGVGLGVNIVNFSMMTSMFIGSNFEYYYSKQRLKYFEKEDNEETKKMFKNLIPVTNICEHMYPRSFKDD